MCTECPKNPPDFTRPQQGGFVVPEYMKAPCGQHWEWKDGWKAISRGRFLAETEVQRIKKEKARESLLGPDNIVTLSLDMSRVVKRQDIETMSTTMYCPWQDDWPSEARYEWSVGWGSDERTFELRWQSPFVGTPGVTTLWTETAVTEQFWKAATGKMVPRSDCPFLGDYSDKGKSCPPLPLV
ncbi:hypothetical protein [Caudoviricetes sp.]|nr:hypothetical protein [Caudoviricetes sp.]